MSLQRKNSRRLKLLRRLGIPIGGDYRLSEAVGSTPATTYLSPTEQRDLLLALAQERRAPVTILRGG